MVGAQRGPPSLDTDQERMTLGAPRSVLRAAETLPPESETSRTSGASRASSPACRPRQRRQETAEELLLGGKGDVEAAVPLGPHPLARAMDDLADAAAVRRGWWRISS